MPRRTVRESSTALGQAAAGRMAAWGQSAAGRVAAWGPTAAAMDDRARFFLSTCCARAPACAGDRVEAQQRSAGGSVGAPDGDAARACSRGAHANAPSPALRFCSRRLGGSIRSRRCSHDERHIHGALLGRRERHRRRRAACDDRRRGSVAHRVRRAAFDHRGCCRRHCRDQVRRRERKGRQAAGGTESGSWTRGTSRTRPTRLCSHAIGQRPAALAAASVRRPTAVFFSPLPRLRFGHRDRITKLLKSKRMQIPDFLPMTHSAPFRCAPLPQPCRAGYPCEPFGPPAFVRTTRLHLYLLLLLVLAQRVEENQARTPAAWHRARPPAGARCVPEVRPPPSGSAPTRSARSFRYVRVESVGISRGDRRESRAAGASRLGRTQRCPFPRLSLFPLAALPDPNIARLWSFRPTQRAKLPSGPTAASAICTI